MLKIITTIDEFVQEAKEPYNIGLTEQIFEYQCTPELKEQIFGLAEQGSSEPFFNAMQKLGIFE